MLLGEVALARANADLSAVSSAEFHVKRIAARGRRCEECDRAQCRIYGDHIRELKDGGAPLDPANVLLRCRSCHTLKPTLRAPRWVGGSGNFATPRGGNRAAAHAQIFFRRKLGRGYRRDDFLVDSGFRAKPV